MRNLRKFAVLFAVVVCSALFAGTATAQTLGSATLRGRVQDSTGSPLIGALVAIQAGDTNLRERLVFSDRGGLFSIANLAAGQYTIKVTKPRFLPAIAAGVQLAAGTNAALTINLQTAMEIVRRGVRRGSLEEMKWVLRSSPSTRPILRMAEEEQETDESRVETVIGGMETSGYFQLYSAAVETPAGVSESVGSQFAVSLPMGGGSEVRLTGQYTESPDQPRGFGASYEFSSGDRKRSSLAINVRQGAMLGAAAAGSQSREVKVEYEEQMQWSDHLVFNYGADIGRAEGVTTKNYIRPEFGVSWVPQARTTIRTFFSQRAPNGSDDPIRGREYFDRSVYIPPEAEQYSHNEIGASHVFSEFLQVSAAAFRDRLGTQAFLVDAEDGRRAIVFFDGSEALTTGMRLHMDRTFRNFEAGLGYTFASAVGFDPDIISPDNLRAQAERQNFHVVTARVKTDIDFTQTAVTAVYRWASGHSMVAVDPYQPFTEYNDPTLSITIAQDLPTLKIFPAKFQAVLDARNLFEPSFGSRRTVQALYPRLLKGGIHIRF